MATIDVTSYLFGKSVPVEVEVSFSLSARGWAEFQESGEFDRLAGILEGLEEAQVPLTHLTPVGRQEEPSNTHSAFRHLFRSVSGAPRPLAEVVRKNKDAHHAKVEYRRS